ncbi:tetratricopeptide repeat protein [Luedemannella helvata]|uniref:BTAD domain-containing putative transcriptional regulator n=1 Tax=Luedemannella helvata TaxID=349315 RepID=A0ABP4WI31_9ACTN
MDTTADHSDFGGLLRTCRRAAGISQRQLADRAGISPAAIRDLEQGRTRRPQRRSVDAMVSALRLTGDNAVAFRRAAIDIDRATPARQVDPAQPVRVRVLGPLSVQRGPGQVPVGRGRRRAVLGRLALSVNATVPIADLVDLLWEAEPPLSPTQAVQTYLSRLRSALHLAAPGRTSVISRAAGGYRLNLPDDQLDLAEFRRQVRQARTAEPARALELLETALALWRGNPLADIPQLRNHPLVTAVMEERAAATLRYADLALAAGQGDRCLPLLRELAAASPLHEPLHARLIAILGAGNRQADALTTYAEIRRRLVEDLGIEPGPELVHAHRRVLRQEPVGKSAASPQPSAEEPRPPAQLPADIHQFTGRLAAISQLDGLLDAHHSTSAVVIAAVSGTAGVGKTAVAVHWAHRVGHRFPDGQLYVNLRGFEPSGSPMAAAEAVTGFLDALGYPSQRLPADPAAQLGLYRSLLVGRRVLLVLDNARDAEQVRPLLPTAPGCFAVVTSRDPLAGLVASDGAHPLALDVLSHDDAEHLLAQRIGPRRTAAEPDVVAGIVDRCAGLPLALAITAARAATQPHLPLAVLAADLRDGDRLDALSTGDAGTDVRSVFSWSYRALSPAAARLFRLLGRHPVPELSVAAAASVAGVAVPRVRPLLVELIRAHLLSEHAPGRYALHDLLHEYAGRLTLDEEPDAVTGRMLDHYLHTARAADGLLEPARDPGPVDAPRAGVTVQAPADHRQAMHWFTVEHRVLLAMADHAGRTGFDPYVWRLAEAAAVFLYRRGLWHDQLTAQRHALRAAERAGDVAAQGSAHVHLARAYVRLRRGDRAEAHLRDALRLYAEHGDAGGQAQTHHYFGLVYEQQGRYREAVDHAQQAVAMCRASGLRFGQGHALNALAWYQAHLGNHHEAVIHCREALEVTRDLGDRAGQANAWDTLGYTHHHLRDHATAATSYGQAIDIYRELGDRYHESVSLGHLAETHLATGRPDSARTAYRDALDALDELGHPDADRVRAALMSLGA